MYSGPGGRTTPTTSPARTPRRAMPVAVASEIRSTSAYDSDQPRGATEAVRSPKRRAASAIVQGRSGRDMAEAYKSSRRTGVRRDLPPPPGTPAATRELRAQGRKTMRKLLDAGMRVFAERGFYAARVDDIVRAARTSHGTFYLYFANKEELLRALAVECAHEMGSLAGGLGAVSVDEEGAAELRRFLESFFSTYARFGPVLRAW